jgi:two-component system, LytTR family, sensor kinase
MYREHVSPALTGARSLAGDARGCLWEARVVRSGDPLLQRPHLLWSLYFAVWTVFAVADAYQTYVLTALLHRALSLPQCFALALIHFYTLALLALPLLWLARRFPLGQAHWGFPVAVLLTASGLLALLKVALDVPVESLFHPNPLLRHRPALEVFQIFFTAHFLFYLVIFWLVLGVAQALDFHRKYRERELRASHLEGQLAVARLQVLKMQLHPHFLFNTLHAISALVHKDVELADRMIARLGELLRTTLEHAGTQEVSLREELDFIKPYLEIEQARLGPRLNVRLEIDPEVLDARVPNLLLQPLVENAVRHGIAPQPGPGVIEVRARRERDVLKLIVRDNGRGLASNYTEGVGVSNTRARLRQLYGAGQRFEMDNHPEGGLQVTVELPFGE